MHISIKNKQGLTMIETLIAIAILLMSAVMPMVIYSNSIVNARYASEQITAMYLAQEAVELVKYRISTELNENVDNDPDTDNWFDTFPENCRGNNSNNTCSIEAPDGIVCGGTGCQLGLFLYATNNLYTHNNTGIPTKFSRTVMFRSPPLFNLPENGNSVSSTVTWESGGEERSVTVKEYITRWR